MKIGFMSFAQPCFCGVQMNAGVYVIYEMLQQTPCLDQFREVCLIVGLDGAQAGIVSLDQDGLRSNNRELHCPLDNVQI